MSLSPNNSNARQPIYALPYGATRLTKVAEDLQDTTTTATTSPAQERLPVSYRKRLSGQLTRLTSLRGDRRSTNMSGTPSSILNRQSSARKPLSSPLTGSPEQKRLYPSSSLLSDPNSFLNPRPAPKPPVQVSKQDGNAMSVRSEGRNTVSSDSKQGEGFNGTILTSALDSKEVQEASLVALQLAAEHPREAAAVRRAAEAARNAGAAAEQAKDAAAVAGGAAVKAEEAALAARREVAYLLRLLR